MTRPNTVQELLDNVQTGVYGKRPAEFRAISLFWIRQTTKLSEAQQIAYLNHCLLVRVGQSFGACGFESGQVDADFCDELAGCSLDILLEHPALPVRIAAMDAYLAELQPHRTAPGVEPITLPAGPPDVRARARDEAVASLLTIQPGQRVALIGVVNPLVAAIRDRGGICLPCDFNLTETQWGDPVADSMFDVLGDADAVLATGMTLSNGTFDDLLVHCQNRSIPLVVYAMSGSAVARQFLGFPLTAVSAEPFPFSHFSAEETVLYRYRARQ